MNDIRDAKPMDVFADKDGKLWRVIGTCSEPVVYMQEIEKSLFPVPGVMTEAHHIRINGGVRGAMWEGFKLIYRPEIKQNPV